MSRLRLAFLRFLPVVILVLVAFGVSPVASTAGTDPVTADAGLTVSGSLAMFDVTPGETYVHTMTVSLGSGASAPVDVRIEARGLGQGLDGSIRPLLPEQDTSPNSARPLIRNIDVAEFQLSPGGSRVVTASIVVPSDFGSATRYAVLYVHALPRDQGAVAFISAVNVPVVLSPAGVGSPESGQITDLSASSPDSGQSLTVQTTFQNTALRHFKALNEVTVTSTNHQVVLSSTTPLTDQSIVPGYARRFEVSLALPDRPPGASHWTYNVESKVLLEDGTVLTSQTTSFKLRGNDGWSLQVGLSLAPETVAMPGDVNGDRVVDERDLESVSEHWGETGAPGWISQDVNGDGVINSLDIITIGNYLGRETGPA
jgi:hypothetical protein